MYGSRWRSQYSDSIRAGSSGDQIPAGERLFAPVQTGPGVLPTSCTSKSGLGVGFNHPPPSSAVVKKSRAIPILPLCIVCSRVNFTFTLNICTWHGLKLDQQTHNKDRKHKKYWLSRAEALNTTSTKVQQKITTFKTNLLYFYAFTVLVKTKDNFFL